MRIMQIITDYIRRSILTTHGDLLVRGASLPERLAAVAVGQVLKSQGLGVIPAWGVPTITETPFTMSTIAGAASGPVSSASLGFRPKLVLFLTKPGSGTTVEISVGFDDATNCRYVGIGDNGGISVGSASHSIYIRKSVGNVIDGHITAMGADTFTVTYTLVGTSDATSTFLAFG